MAIQWLPRFGAAFAFLGIVSCGGSSAPVPRPTTLTYSHNPAAYVVGSPIAPNAPAYGGGAPASYSVRPPLPAGLRLDPASGVISGTPTLVLPPAEYVVTAANGAGQASAYLDLRVNDLPPSVSYGGGVLRFTTGVAVPPLTPASTGGAVVGWEVSPALPDGLSLDPLDGTLRGTPTAIAASQGYKVTATNSGGTGQATLDIVVVPPAPVISVQPSDQVAGLKSFAAFGLAVSGTGPLSWQWYRDGVPIEGATRSSYIIPTTAVADQGATFHAVVADAYGGSATSRRARLTIAPGSFRDTGPLATAREGHTATLLGDGKVLVVGGYKADWPAAAATASAELYDPAAGTFAPTGSLAQARTRFTATLLADGTVLVAGGYDPATKTPLASAERYDPATGRFSPVGPLAAARYDHAAAALPDGRVLVVGGADAGGGTPLGVEIYDPSSGSFGTTGSLGTGRRHPLIARLGDGQVLVAGGFDASGPFRTVELYHPDTGTFSPAGATITIGAYESAALLLDGTLMVTGGYGAFGYPHDGAECYDPKLGTSTLKPSMAYRRALHTSTLLPGGKVLVAGGRSIFGPDSPEVSLWSAEVYDPATGAFTPTAAMRVPRADFTATLLADGRVLVVGGNPNGDGSGSLSPAAELYDPSDPNQP